MIMYSLYDNRLELSKNFIQLQFWTYMFMNRVKEVDWAKYIFYYVGNILKIPSNWGQVSITTSLRSPFR